MDVYGEYLFLENFIAGYGIIRLTAVMCGRRAPRYRMVSGAVMCGMFSFIIFLELPRPAEFFSGVIFAGVVVYAVFSPVRPAAAFKLTAVFYIAGFMTGGAAIAAILASGSAGTVSNGVFYTDGSAFVLMAAGGAAAAAMGVAMINFIKRKALRSGEVVSVVIDMMGKNITCKARLDTGNNLREPVSGKPVSVIERGRMESAWGNLYERHMLDNRIRIIPYSSVGCDSGSMTAVRCDSMIIERGGQTGGRIYLRNVYLGLYDGIFSCSGDEERCSLLLQPDLLSGRDVR